MNLLTPLRRAIGRSPLAGALRDRRLKRALRAWTSEDQERAAFYAQFVGDGDLCFDVGANLGNRTKVFLRLGATVVAVEPQRRCADFLASVYRDDPRVRLERTALGESEGRAEIRIADASTISSMSAEWIEAVTRTRRFEGHTWSASETVEVTTLDRLIDRHGVPKFVKIDVEGFEYPVVRGLTRAVGAVSFEFTPEYLDAALRCVEHLAGLGASRWNLSTGETMRLELDPWVTAERIARILGDLRGRAGLFGDVYARF